MASRTKRYKTCKHSDCKRLQNSIIQKLFKEVETTCKDARTLAGIYRIESTGACSLATRLYDWFINKYGEGA